jgi:hypothetical protein
MTSMTKGSFTLDIGIVKLGAELSDDDRQCAWELYSELSTRVAVTGKSNDSDCTDFNGELYHESLTSLYTFFKESRNIMRKFPVGRLQADVQNHLGVIISKMLSDVLRPFLEKWQADYRHWWENQSNPRVEPIERQKAYPKHDEMLVDWTNVRLLMRQLQETLVQEYKLISVQS